MRLYQLKERAQGVYAARPITLSGCAGFVPHHLGNSPSRCPGGLSQQRKGTAQPVNCQALNCSALQCLGMALARVSVMRPALPALANTYGPTLGSVASICTM